MQSKGYAFDFRISFLKWAGLSPQLQGSMMDIAVYSAFGLSLRLSTGQLRLCGLYKYIYSSYEVGDVLSKRSNMVRNSYPMVVFFDFWSAKNECKIQSQ